MKYIKALVITVLIATLSACGAKGQSNEHIDLVKHKVIRQGDTVSQMFNNWDVCEERYWVSEDQNHDEDLILVSFNCEFDIDEFKSQAKEHYGETLASQGKTEALKINDITQVINFLVRKSNNKITPSSSEMIVNWENGKSYSYNNFDPSRALKLAEKNMPKLNSKLIEKKQVYKWLGKFVNYYTKAK
jgi:hypothetical protein